MHVQGVEVEVAGGDGADAEDGERDRHARRRLVRVRIVAVLVGRVLGGGLLRVRLLGVLPLIALAGRRGGRVGRAPVGAGEGQEVEPEHVERRHGGGEHEHDEDEPADPAEPGVGRAFGHLARREAERAEQDLVLREEAAEEGDA